MLKGKIALSISPFLVVDDNIHIAPKNITIKFSGSIFILELPLNVCIVESWFSKQVHILRVVPLTDNRARL